MSDNGSSSNAKLPPRQMWLTIVITAAAVFVVAVLVFVGVHFLSSSGTSESVREESGSAVEQEASSDDGSAEEDVPSDDEEADSDQEATEATDASESESAAGSEDAAAQSAADAEAEAAAAAAAEADAAVANAQAQGLQTYTGTVDIVNGSQLIDEEGLNYQSFSYSANETHAVLRLDAPLTITAETAAGDGEYRTETATLIGLAYDYYGDVSYWQGYAGQRVIVSTNGVWWQTDASLPANEPRAWDMNPQVIYVYA